MNRVYRADIDFIKGLAIIAVVLYHIGILPYGYLGVDTFFVINGYFIIPKLVSAVADGKFSFIEWFKSRVSRFLPIVIIASAICLLYGFFAMIPDDYENLAESVVASEIFGVNILSAITTGNYWDSVNEYKPLMHFWYLGILVQFYFIFPLLLVFIKKIFQKNAKPETILKYFVILICIVSFLLYLFLDVPESAKFYYLPYRLWEIGLGGVIYYLAKLHIPEFVRNRYIHVFAILLLLCCYLVSFKSLNSLNTITIVGDVSLSNTYNISKEFILVIVTLLSSILLLQKPETLPLRRFVLPIVWTGKMSLSIFVWHQAFLAFMRYSFMDNMRFWHLVIYALILSLISIFSFRYIEKIRFDTLLKKCVTGIAYVSIMIVALCIYKNAGVVRDVPELGITVSNPYVNRNTEYTDRIYAYDKPFTNDDNIKVLIVGNSFARDFANVLLESSYANSFDLSYSFSFDENMSEKLEECDFMFCFYKKGDIPSWVWSRIDETCKVYGIGTKSYGKSFGPIYAKRHTPGYYDSTIPVPEKLEKLNSEWKESWEGNYVDFLEASKTDNGTIRLFTPEHMIISFDCRHLTPAGCKFYASEFNIGQLFNQL